MTTEQSRALREVALSLAEFRDLAGLPAESVSVCLDLNQQAWAKFVLGMARENDVILRQIHSADDLKGGVVVAGILFRRAK